MSEEKNIHCSFCGRSKNEAEMMIAGVDAHICDRCVEQAGGILHTELGEAPQTSPLDVAVYAGLGIYDTMQVVNPDVATICTGMAASMGAVLMCAGTAGKRSALKHSRIMIHQPMGGAQGQASDMEITLTEILKLKKELYSIIAHHSGQPFDKVEADSDRDYWMTSEEAKAYGMVDEILLGKSQVK